MSNLQYHSVEPESNRTQFKAFDTVDMIINNPRNLVKNFISILNRFYIRCLFK